MKLDSATLTAWAISELLNLAAIGAALGCAFVWIAIWGTMS